MALVLVDTQKVGVTIQPVDARGNPAPVENVVWATSNEAIAALDVAEGGLSAVVKAVGALGSVQVTVTADAKIGEGEVLVQGVLDIEVIAGQAVTVQIVAGTPEEQTL
jgi:hypothetical protein